MKTQSYYDRTLRIFCFGKAYSDDELIEYIDSLTPLQYERLYSDIKQLSTKYRFGGYGILNQDEEKINYYKKESCKKLLNFMKHHKQPQTEYDLDYSFTANKLHNLIVYKKNTLGKLIDFLTFK